MQRAGLDWLRIVVIGVVNSVAAYFWIVGTIHERMHLRAAMALLLCLVVITPRKIPYGRYFGFRSAGSAAKSLRHLPPEDGNQELSWFGYVAFVISVFGAAGLCLWVQPSSIAAIFRGAGAIIVVSLLLLAMRAWVAYQVRSRNRESGW